MKYIKNLLKTIYTYIHSILIWEVVFYDTDGTVYQRELFFFKKFAYKFVQDSEKEIAELNLKYSIGGAQLWWW